MDARPCWETKGVIWSLATISYLAMKFVAILASMSQWLESKSSIFVALVTASEMMFGVSKWICQLWLIALMMHTLSSSLSYFLLMRILVAITPSLGKSSHQEFTFIKKKWYFKTSLKCFPGIVVDVYFTLYHGLLTSLLYILLWWVSHMLRFSWTLNC